MRRFSFKAAAAWAEKSPPNFPTKKGVQRRFPLRPKTRENAGLLRRGLRECVQSTEEFGDRQRHHALLLGERRGLFSRVLSLVFGCSFGRRGQHAQFEKSRAAARTGMDRLPRGLLTLFYGLSRVYQRRNKSFRRWHAQETPLAILYAFGETASHPDASSGKRFVNAARG